MLSDADAVLRPFRPAPAPSCILMLRVANSSAPPRHQLGLLLRDRQTARRWAGRKRYSGLAREFYNLVMTCPKCNGEMEVGFIAGPRVVEWIEDPLHKSTLLGVKVREGKPLPIRTFRCIDCGFLESYAK
jgi:hypothetical protein